MGLKQGRRGAQVGTSQRWRARPDRYFVLLRRLAVTPASVWAMTSSRQFTNAADGRTLCFAEWGALDGFPVFSLHGTPGGRLKRHLDESKYAEAVQTTLSGGTGTGTGMTIPGLGGTGTGTGPEPLRFPE